MACETWLYVRSFGQVFNFKDKQGVYAGVRGPVSIHQAVSVSPMEIESMQITKSVNGEKKAKGENRASDAMGMKYFVRFGLYLLKGSINVQLAEKTGFTEEDAQTIKECLRALFVNGASSARVHRSVRMSLNDPNRFPTCADDYTIHVEALPGLTPEVIEGV